MVSGQTRSHAAHGSEPQNTILFYYLSSTTARGFGSLGEGNAHSNLNRKEEAGNPDARHLKQAVLFAQVLLQGRIGSLAQSGVGAATYVIPPRSLKSGGVSGSCSRRHHLALIKVPATQTRLVVPELYLGSSSQYIEKVPRLILIVSVSSRTHLRERMPPPNRCHKLRTAQR